MGIQGRSPQHRRNTDHRLLTRLTFEVSHYLPPQYSYTIFQSLFATVQWLSSAPALFNPLARP
ncbi:hypothetical protein FRB91_010528, partial [Serendipita sp. 411]